MTVIEYVLSRLRSLGITDIFGVPGDFAFPINDAIVESKETRWIGCCNELNAAYAADGYARIKGFGAVCTTYGVGELSAINAVAGAYAEHVPIFHLVGAPNMSTQSARALMHHTLGNGEYDLFHRMSQPVVCASAIITPQNVACETERLIGEAAYHRRPVYMAFPADYANEPVLSEAQPDSGRRSHPEHVKAAADAITEAIEKARSACFLPGNLLGRLRLQGVMTAVIDASGVPFATMFRDKSVLDEQDPNYVGMYVGKLLNEEVREFVEGCDLVIEVGTLLTDFNSGAFTAKLDPEKTVNIAHHWTQVGGKIYASVEIGDILKALTPRLRKREWKKLGVSTLGEPEGKGGDPITAAALYPRWEKFLRENDILIAETGTVSMGMGFARMPVGAVFHNQSLWASIGWATPAAFGAAVAAGERRVVLITGDGAHQFTVQEVGQFGDYKLRPIIFVLNNSGYLIERLLCKDPAIAYNDIAPWRYAELPRALGCDGWFTARATTCGELDQALENAGQSSAGAYVEVVTDAYAAPPFALKLHESFRRIYK
ncbi:MAG TPA: thiamine pyrophosphate-binding protein [Terriglobales bacterium]|nr:thiamine pyrophosphate-binding protein [Terriglobales bacterium]